MNPHICHPRHRVSHALLKMTGALRFDAKNIQGFFYEKITSNWFMETYKSVWHVLFALKSLIMSSSISNTADLS